MSNAEKSNKEQTVPETKQDSTELTEEQMKEISGGPTAVEMPGRFTTINTSIGNITGGTFGAG